MPSESVQKFATLIQDDFHTTFRLPAQIMSGKFDKLPLFSFIYLCVFENLPWNNFFDGEIEGV